MPPTIGPKIKYVSRKWVRATYSSLRIAYQAVDRPPAKYSKKKVFLKVEISYVRGGDAIFSAGGETFWGLSCATILKTGWISESESAELFFLISGSFEF